MKIIILGLLSLIFIGCSERSDIYPSGEGTYTISNQDISGFSGLQDIKSEAYKEASQFCKKKNKDFKTIKIETTDMETTKPPYAFGNYPRVDLRFKCITQHSRQ